MNPFAILLAILGIVIQSVFIFVEHREKYVLSVALKGTASVLFCVIGAIAMSMASANQSFAKLIVFGLCFGALGDILLNLRLVFPANGQKIFLMGVVAFLAGHILYLCAIVPLSQNLPLCIVVGAILAAALLTWIFKVLTVKPALKVFGVLYLGAIVLMTTVAIGNVIAAPRAATWLYAAGGVLFTLSDIVLIFNMFGKKQKFSMRITNLTLYYLGQLLIAFSLFYI